MSNVLVPVLTSVSFEYTMSNDDRILVRDFERYVFDLSEHPTSAWLNEPERDFNQFFRELLKMPNVAVASLSVSWNDGFSATIPMPKTQNAPDITCVGDLLAKIGRVMQELPTFANMKPEENAMLKLVDRASRQPVPA